MSKVYGFKDKSTAERLARPGDQGGIGYPNSPATAQTITVELSGTLTAYSDTAAPPSVDAQIVSYGTTGLSTTSNWTDTELPTVKVYNSLGAEFSSGDHVICCKMDGRFFVVIGLHYKSLVRFTLDAALTTSDASQTATITDQYGPGLDNTTTSGGIIVHNMETSAAGTYMFEGNLNDAGLAMWDQGTDYRIIQIECDTTPAGGGGGETPGGETP